MLRDCGVIIVAAGKGVRLGGEIPKQFQLLERKPLFAWSLDFFLGQEEVAHVVLAVPTEWQKRVQGMLSEWGILERVSVVEGGALRQDSVLNGIESLPPECRIVAVHDAARPFPPHHFSELCQLARECGGAIFGCPIVETVKRVREGWIEDTLDRSVLWAAQTPQVFARETLHDALRKARQEGKEFTDDAAAVAATGSPVRMVKGSRWNLKITTPEDLLFAEWIAMKFHQKKCCDDISDSTGSHRESLLREETSNGNA